MNRNCNCITITIHAVRVATQYVSAPVSWQYLRIYSPSGTGSGMLTSATSWPLTIWPWKWCLSHVWRWLPLCQFWSS